MMMNYKKRGPGGEENHLDGRGHWGGVVGRAGCSICGTRGLEVGCNHPSTCKSSGSNGLLIAKGDANER